MFAGKSAMTESDFEAVITAFFFIFLYCASADVSIADNWLPVAGHKDNVYSIQCRPDPGKLGQMAIPRLTF
ncbi:MAG: hypothetical protein M3X11_00030 [Acidobacteriota bacterium]|nr:hypothetical protein [Acidobacteriota bacterium]